MAVAALGENMKKVWGRSANSMRVMSTLHDIGHVKPILPLSNR